MSEKIAVLDTNTLVEGIIKGHPVMEPIFSQIKQGQMLMGVTKPVKDEYHKVFNYKTTADKAEITQAHREKLKELVSFAHVLSDKHITGNLTRLDEMVINYIPRQDWRFVLAADMAAGFIGGISYLISRDKDLLSVGKALKPLNIHVIHPKNFVERGL